MATQVSSGGRAAHKHLSSQLQPFWYVARVCGCPMKSNVSMMPCTMHPMARPRSTARMRFCGLKGTCDREGQGGVRRGVAEG
eukprot:5157245-Pyramimonas_sp.AAC.1